MALVDRKYDVENGRGARMGVRMAVKAALFILESARLCIGILRQAK